MIVACVVCEARPALRPDQTYPTCSVCASGPGFARWHSQPCAREGCTARRWKHIANARAVAEGRPPAWDACVEFLDESDDDGHGAPVPVEPAPLTPMFAGAGRAS